ALEAAGAELVYFSPISDAELPDVDAFYIGGGFPEVFMHELEKNSSIRLRLKAAIENDKPVYAECGGLMYLSRSITWKDDGKGTAKDKEKNKAEMVGALPCDIFMNKKPRGHGYIRLESISNVLFDEGREIKAHEFHYSELSSGEDFEFAYRVIRGYGVDGKNDGIIYKNVLASYAHLHSLAVPEWAPRFIDFIRAKLGKR
ncbi:MAG: cobyrinic acid a,c-diamide synthase, partial [Rubrobacteridae bacterium]|nr:cobyrinic acid a,c-diamide synthase [Rubrobacteridae bacterium]